MEVQLITKQDLEEFRVTLLRELQAFFSKKTEDPKRYLKSYQVKNMLKVSGGTLHTLRSNGTLKFSRIGHIIYYNYDDIMQLMEGNTKKKK
ncbi:helix-turn-helix domain-containing protein [uncultured Mucilaginibacter sp.]|uniref:helix-turn-helix domain-containing protein n=1 Tax=uncultured Mucilaginibacter sp. TaxID=797541 RepID=UPI0025DBFEE9|nr:helix-turn-helix domain-containing protein [uncultured Mucilaginibacter sp.]